MKRIRIRTLASVFLASLAAGVQAHVWDELATLARPDGEGGWTLEKYSFIQPTTYTNAVFLDYNNDGNLDMLLMGQGGDWNIPSSKKFVLLYRNLGPDMDFRFENVADTGLPQVCDEAYYNPISVGDFNHDGYTDIALMYYSGGRNVEIFLNDGGTGKFHPMGLSPEAATNGSVMFADLDNDGWLDLEFSGYGDRSATTLKMYRNNRDGSVSDISDPAVTGAFQGASSVADINGDGHLDIISCGNGDNWVCLSTVYLREPGGEGWKRVAGNESGIAGASRATPLVADFNADGIMDIIVNGEPSDGTGFRTRIYYGKEDGGFEMDSGFPIIGVNQDGGINMGDWNADGNMDIIIGGYLGRNDDNVERYSSPLRVYENRPDLSDNPSNTFPQPPASVSASLVGRELLITWQPGSDKESATEALRYNLMVRNETTGETFMLIPADPTTGHLKVGTDLQTSLSSQVSSYTMSTLGDGEYTIGVQTLDQAYAGSPFAGCTLSVDTSGIDELPYPSSPDMVSILRIDIHPNGIIVNPSGTSNYVENSRSFSGTSTTECSSLSVSEASRIPVTVYDAIGRIVVVGVTGELIPLPHRGIYVVATPSASAKIVK